MKARILLPCARWLGNLAHHRSISENSSSENDLLGLFLSWWLGVDGDGTYVRIRLTELPFDLLGQDMYLAEWCECRKDRMHDYIYFRREWLFGCCLLVLI